MKTMLRIFAVALALVSSAAFAQSGSGTSPLSVPKGGTGISTATAYGILYGNGTSQLGVTGAGSNGQLFIGQSSAAAQFKTVTGDITIDNLGVVAVGANKISNSMLRQSAALSLVGRSANSTGNVADISASAGSSCAFRESSSVVACGTLSTGAYAANSVTNAKLAQMGNSTVKCRVTAGTGDPEDCNAAQVRSVAGLVIGTHVQAWDSDLDCIAAISSSGLITRNGAGTCAARQVVAPAAGITVTNPAGTAGDITLALANDLAAIEALSSTGYAVRTATDAWAQRTFGAGFGLTATNGDGVAGNTSYAITDAELVALGGLTSAADSCIYFTGSGTAGLASCPSYGRSLFAASDASTARGTLGLGTAALLNSGTSGATVPLLNGNNAWSGSQEFQGAIAFSGDITPAQITATQNDYAPSGFSTASVVRVSTDASRDITGLAGGSDGRTIYILNVGSFGVVLKDEGAGSTAANRFGFGADLTLASKQGATLVYDATASRWRQVGGPSASGGGTGTVTQVTCNGGATVITTSGVCASREVLSANRTYYVRTDGSDSNNGLANTSGGAFLTIQKAIDVAVALDLSIYEVTIQVGNGTYTGANTLKNYIGVGPITIVGDETTPSNVVISTTGANNFTATAVPRLWQLRGMKMQTTTSGHCIRALTGSNVTFQNIDFGATGGGSASHLVSSSFATIGATGNYTISGDTFRHMWTETIGLITIAGRTVTLSGSRAITTFVYAINGGVVQANSNTYSGPSATGTRYDISGNAVVFTNGGGATYFPGGTSGTTATGGQYL